MCSGVKPMKIFTKVEIFWTLTYGPPHLKLCFIHCRLGGGWRSPGIRGYFSANNVPACPIIPRLLFLLFQLIILEMVSGDSGWTMQVWLNHFACQWDQKCDATNKIRRIGYCPCQSKAGGVPGVIHWWMRRVSYHLLQLLQSSQWW